MIASIRLQRLIAFTSLALLVGKLWAWHLTHSVAILTDALESIVNVIAGFIGLYSIVFAARPRDTNHPYGHGKAEFISAAIEGTLIIIAGMVIMYESTRRLLYPGQLEQLDTGIIISAITAVINLLLGTYAVRIGLRQRSMTLEAAGKHLRTDAWSTFAIIAGLILVLVTGWQWIDGIVAFLFGIMILATGYKVIRKSLAGIMDETDQQLAGAIIEFLQRNRRPQWIDLHNFRVIRYGATLHVDAHLTVPWYHQVKDADEEIHSLETLVRSQFGDKVEMFIHIDACMPFQCSLCSVDPCPERQAPFQKQIPWTEETVWTDAKHGKDTMNRVSE